MNFGGLKELQENEKVKRLPKIVAPSQVFQECVIDKKHSDKFPQGKSKRAKRVLELVHFDLCGSITPISNEGK